MTAHTATTGEESRRPMWRVRTPLRSALGDAALWAVFCAAGVLWFRNASATSFTRDLLLPLIVLAVAVPLARHRPGTAVLLVNALCALGLANPVSPANAYVMALAGLSCLLGAHTATAHTPLLVLAGCLVIDLALCALLQVPAVWWFYALTVLPSALLLPWLAGRYWRGRRELVRGGWQLAHSLEEQQHLVAERARLTERADIAADMHDSLGHSLTLVALRAGALELSPTLIPQDRDDVAELRRTISDAVEQLRETVAVLRDEPLARASPAATDTVEELLGRVLASGVPVQWQRNGPLPALSPVIERGVYRVVQEALTNATKHAPGSTVRVSITHDSERTHVRIVNSPPPAGPLPGTVAGNRGLAGLRERVTVLGGTLQTGPYEGGFQVSAILPHHATENPTPRALPKDITRPLPTGGTQDTGPEDTATCAVPESARRLAHLRRGIRWRFATVFAAPAVAAVFFLPTAAYLAYQLATSVLPPSRYEELRSGQSRTEIAHLLPPRPFPYPPDHVRFAPRPPGTICEFYRSNGNLLDQVDLYRLCYSGSRLVTKDTLKAGAE
ncbi:sensor histidine kinase [Streptomyces inhibens]|uniref:sensor histidine kinase n=1 Tax=Streptomyces inhibens TaxID=2293571 RepID=UPI001EE780F8|nr:histidine kinase [Streptomyces inhibens]UKY54783.1 histidine kinase [Streptomyces inhibens]